MFMKFYGIITKKNTIFKTHAEMQEKEQPLREISAYFFGHVGLIVPLIPYK